MNLTFLDLYVTLIQIKIFATQAKLGAEKDEIEKLQTYESSLFIYQSYFFNDESQSFLICQPILNTFTVFTGLTETIIAW